MLGVDVHLLDILFLYLFQLCLDENNISNFKKTFKTEKGNMCHVDCGVWLNEVQTINAI